MADDDYLRGVLAKYAVSYGPDSPAMRTANSVAPTLRAWAGSHLNELKASGSYAKSTPVSGTTDIDIFISLTPDAPELETIYNNLARRAHDEGWNPRLQNVSIGIQIDGVKIDLVPGRQQRGYQNWHSLWRRKAKTWTQTNIDEHINRVRDSGRTDEIRLIKIWRKNHGLDFPSFYLELTVLDSLSGCRDDLPRNVQTVLAYLRDAFVKSAVSDPANTSNKISDDLTLIEKQRIATQAAASHAETTWGPTLW